MVADRFAQFGQFGQASRPQPGQDRTAAAREDAGPVDEVPLRDVGDRAAPVGVGGVPAQHALHARQVGGYEVEVALVAVEVVQAVSPVQGQSGMVTPPADSKSPTTLIGRMPSERGESHSTT